MSISKFRMADSFLSSPGWEEFKRTAPITRGFNHLIAGTHFERVFQRWPLPLDDRRSTINDFILGRMIAMDWSRLHTDFVDKETAKIAAKSILPSILVPETLLVVPMVEMRCVDDLRDVLAPFSGTMTMAKPTHASGSAILLKNPVSPGDLLALYELASRDYVSIMREMQYFNLPKKIIVESMVPSIGAASLDDYKFHCVRGEPLACQIDHDRFEEAWSRIFRVPTFEPIDQDDGLVPPKSFRFPTPDRLAQMTTAARALAVGFDFVRVDLYDGLDGIYFGELTFSPAASLGVAPAREGNHFVNNTHRIYSDLMISALK